MGVGSKRGPRYIPDMNKASEWQSLRRAIESLKDSVSAEIRNYPPPIPACDAHFNHLLELRRLLPLELARLDDAAKNGSLSIDGFVRGSPCEETLAKLTSPA